MKNIYINLSPYEVSRYIECRGEAKNIIVHILRNWKLQQPAYEDILDEIPDFAIKQHLRMHREKNETCAISDSNRKTIIYYKRGYLQDVCRDEDAQKQIDAMTLRDKIVNEVRELKAEPLMQKASAAIDLVEDNYPDVLDYVFKGGRIAGLLRVLELIIEEDN